jgi:hypothetical protein
LEARAGAASADFASSFGRRGRGFGAAGLAGLAAGLGLSASAGGGFRPRAPPPERFESPRRCTLPITALRVTPPSSLAIWLADCPSPHIFLSNSTRSSVQDMPFSAFSSGGADLFQTRHMAMPVPRMKAPF